jgi:regulator of RNase E activity RraA
VRPSDLILGDADGVVAIPRERADEVVAKANEKVLGENKTRDALLRGEKLSDVFRRFGVL